MVTDAIGWLTKNNNNNNNNMSRATDHNFKNSVIEQLKDLSEDYNFLDPVTVLQGIANGVDLRTQSRVYQWILDHETDSGEEPPEPLEWDELVDIIKSEFRFMPVSRSDSASAAKTLIEYMHNKKKAVEVNDKSKGEAEITELKRSEIKRFERNFNNEY